MRLRLYQALLTLLYISLTAAASGSDNRWTIDSINAITWTVDSDLPHYDHIEMSGETMSAVLRYGVNADHSLFLERSLVWPMLRTIPNDTHASLTRRFSHNFLAPVMANRLTLNNQHVNSITLDGKLSITGTFTIGHSRATKDNAPIPPTIEVTHTIAPSTTLPMLCENYSIKNIGTNDIELCIPAQRITYSTPREQGVYGTYSIIAKTRHDNDFTVTLSPGESTDFASSIQAIKSHEPELSSDMAHELSLRDSFTRHMLHSLVLETPDSVLNTMFAFAKIRAAESIFRTKGGLMQSPGGEAYYAAIWANDQAEYINPFFPFLGYNKGNESAQNSFRHFARFINSEFTPLPSSIIAEGDDTWNGAGDRGDAAMIAYGATRFALAYGDKHYARSLWPLIEWCLEYCRRNVNDAGVVVSDKDELEGRFPAGDANLSTSTLYYDALISSSYLARDLGYARLASKYRNQATTLRRAIETHFGAQVEGFDTYQYYDGNDVLRSWICMPLVVGIFDRKDATIDALLSPQLLTQDGLLTQSGTNTYWDRSTLYALRGIFASGESNKALDFLTHYSNTRLLSEHVPYPIEAWPEGNQRHLSTESALYCRIFTEGLFGLRPTGLTQFQLTPHLPDAWDQMALRNISGFGPHSFDIEVTRQDNKLRVTVTRNGQTILTRLTHNNSTLTIAL